MKSVILTGGTGLIGNAILRELISQKKKVLMASSTKGLISQHPLLSIVPFHLSEPKLKKDLLMEMQKCEGVIHCAAIRPSSRKPMEMAKLYADNVAGSANLMAAAIEFDVPSFIYLSGVNLFSSDKTLLEESALPEPRDLYLLAKWVGEQTSNLLNSKSNTSFLNLRVSAPYGPNWKNKAVIPLFLEKALKNEPITLMGTGKREQVFTYVDDIANATLLSLQKKLSGTYNIAGNQTLNMQQLASAVIKAVPKTKSKIIYTGQADPNEDQKRIVPTIKFKDECGWEPATSLIEGVQKMVREMKSPPTPFYSKN
jgi:UDP-glucose 4-epimerase